jgi:AcrR family transcriptional regulator/transcriptional regulator with XRE-family HTH domain
MTIQTPSGSTPFPRIGDTIRQLRHGRGISLRRLAEQLSVSPATLSAIENGHTGVSAVRVARIAELLDVPVERIFTTTTTTATAAGGSVPTARDRSATEAADAAGRRPGQDVRTSAGVFPGVGDWRQYGPLVLDPALAAALSAFVDYGYHGSTMRTIAGRAGLSVSGLYHYYESKYEMLVALLDLTMQDLDARMRAARSEGADPVARVALLVECLALFHSHRRETAFLGASEMRSLQPEERARLAAIRRDQQQMLDDEVAAAVAAGQLRARAPKDAARAVVTMCTAIVQWYRPDGPTSPEELALRYVDFALDLLGRSGSGVG